ncbi:gamma-glutamylcyclotransferase [Verrucomicrobiota bacterium]
MDCYRPYFLYGTLRRGHFNYHRLALSRNTLWLGRALLEGARMYDLGGLPCIVLTGLSKDTAVGELVMFRNAATLRAVRKMELAAGYHEVTVSVTGQEAYTFVFDHVPDNATHIASGDWSTG